MKHRAEKPDYAPYIAVGLTTIASAILAALMIILMAPEPL